MICPSTPIFHGLLRLRLSIPPIMIVMLNGKMGTSILMHFGTLKRSLIMSVVGDIAYGKPWMMAFTCTSFPNRNLCLSFHGLTGVMLYKGGWIGVDLVPL